jgi:hypothetical protein
MSNFVLDQIHGQQLVSSKAHEKRQQHEKAVLYSVNAKNRLLSHNGSMHVTISVVNQEPNHIDGARDDGNRNVSLIHGQQNRYRNAHGEQTPANNILKSLNMIGSNYSLEKLRFTKPARRHKNKSSE